MLMRTSGLWLLPLLLTVSSAAGAADLVGPESCKGCHPAAYAAWQQSKHARATDSLSDLQKKDARCLSCHAPDQSQGVTNISCETCHGGGQYYAPAYVMKDPELSRLVGLLDPSEKQCRTCHDASSPSLRPFNFVESLKAIDHWSAERPKKAARAEATPPPPAKK
jgi:formate-dependent nitrite reductase cytochrome c552 subunit